MLRRATLLRCGACSPRPTRFNSFYAVCYKGLLYRDAAHVVLDQHDPTASTWCAAKGYSGAMGRMQSSTSNIQQLPCCVLQRATLLRCGTCPRPAKFNSFYCVLQRATLLRCGACSPRPAKFNSFCCVPQRATLLRCGACSPRPAKFNSFCCVPQRATLLRCGACSPRPTRFNSFYVVCYKRLLYCDAAHVVLDQQDSTASMLCATKGYSIAMRRM